MKILKTIFFGYHASGLVTLKTLIKKKKFDVIKVFMPLSVNEEYKKRLRYLCKVKNIPVVDVKTTLEILKSINFEIDLIISDSFPFLIKDQILKLAKRGAFNLHEGRLPQYRGAHVMNWQIINGEKEIGICIHKMTEEFDKGDVIHQEVVILKDEDDINSIYLKLIKKIPLLINKLEKYIKHPTKLKKQSEKRAKYFNRRKPEDGLISWSLTNRKIFNLIRALKDPWPNAFTYNGTKILKIKNSYQCKNTSKKYKIGQVFQIINDHFLVKTRNGSLLITSYEGKMPRLNTILH